MVTRFVSMRVGHEFFVLRGQGTTKVPVAAPTHLVLGQEPDLVRQHGVHNDVEVRM